MQKDKWHVYWQKRAVMAENALAHIHAIADLKQHGDICKVCDDHFESVAKGGVEDTELPSGDTSGQ